jgi:hypothetical protein
MEAASKQGPSQSDWLPGTTGETLERKCSPTPATPLSLDAPKPGMAFPCSVNDIDVPVGKAVAGCAHNDTIPIIFDDADQ